MIEIKLNIYFSDFVTPLKKRRLARESLSRDSLTSESPTPSTSQSAGSCFLNVPEPGEAKLDGIRNKNGFRPFFSPLRPDSIDEESSSVSRIFFFFVNSLHSGLFCMLFCRLRIFSKSSFSKNSFRNTIGVSNSLDRESRSGQTFCGALSGPKPFAKFISRRH